jgi:hypothetical protein
MKSTLNLNNVSLLIHEIFIVQIGFQLIIRKFCQN